MQITYVLLFLFSGTSAAANVVSGRPGFALGNALLAAFWFRKAWLLAPTTPTKDRP